ncbi:MAG: hypothetical protein WD533_00375 [Dehalococcoidia bacterium]
MEGLHTRSRHLSRVLWIGLALLVSMALLQACGTDTEPTPDDTEDPTPTPVDTGTGPDPTATPDEPVEEEVSFEGETVTMVVGLAPGGGYDTFTRMASTFLPEYLPGNPNIVVQNLTGSGGQRGTQATQTAEPDGLTAGIIHPRFIRRDLLGVDVPDFSIDNTTWIGALGGIPTTNAHYTRKTFATSFDDILAMGETVTSGATAPGSSGNMGAWFVELVGGPVQNVFGYGGTAEISAAFDREELDMSYTANPEIAPRLYPEWGEQQLVAPMWWWITPPEEDDQFMEWMDILGTEPPPHLFDVIDAEDWQQRAFRSTVDVGTLAARTFHLPPGVPDEMVQVWREALEQVANDPRFQELAATNGYETGWTDPGRITDGLIEIRDGLEEQRVRDLFLELSGGEE